MLVSPRQIIDCHVHFSRAPHEVGSSSVYERLTTALRRYGVQQAVVMPDSEPGSPVPELAETLALASKAPGLYAAGTVGIDRLNAPCLHRLRELTETRQICGLKLYPGFEDYNPSDPRCEPLYDLCEEHAIPVIFHSGESSYPPERQKLNHPYEIAKVADVRPDVQIVIAHFAQPHLHACRDVILQYPNVHADISGLAHPSVTDTCSENVIWRILTDVATRAPCKVLFGTDWPICGISAHKSLVDSLPIAEENKTAIFSGNARGLFHLDIPRHP